MTAVGPFAVFIIYRADARPVKALAMNSLRSALTGLCSGAERTIYDGEGHPREGASQSLSRPAGT